MKALDRETLERQTAFIDFEASSLNHGSYPIEIGWALPDSGEVEAHLIRPLPGWTDWDEISEQVHGIERETLLREGGSAATVLARTEQALCGRICFCDGLTFDGYWMARLMEGAGHAGAFASTGAAWQGRGITLRSFDGLIRDLLGLESRVWLEQQPGITAHRARDDARHLMTIYQRAQDRSQV